MSKDVVIVTRHAGAVEWLAREGITGTVISHATADDVRNKHVYGALPLHLAALARSVTAIDMPYLPADQRGLDLTPAQMDNAGAQLRTYVVSDVTNLPRQTPDGLHEIVRLLREAAANEKIIETSV